MALKRFKTLLGADMVSAKPAWYRNGETGKPEKAHCPHCKNERARKKPACDLTQFGFEWDSHITVFRCKCGRFFFAEYNIWHVGEEKSE